MSTQGTGAITPLSFERQLLDGWGDWARDDLGMGYNRVDLVKHGGVGFLFSDADFYKADVVIAGLPPGHKRVIKQVYLFRKGLKLDEQRKSEAVAAFAESLKGDGEECR